MPKLKDVERKAEAKAKAEFQQFKSAPGWHKWVKVGLVVAVLIAIGAVLVFG